jgi:hypothetical protein
MSHVRRIEPALCPHCGQELPEVRFYGLVLTPAERLVLEAVQLAGPAGISRQRLVEACYEGKGPRSVNAVMVIMAKLNRKLRPIGREVASDRKQPSRWRLQLCVAGKKGQRDARQRTKARRPERRRAG